MKKLLLFFSFLLLVTSCVPKVALSSDYWQKPSKVGVFVNVNPPAKFREGSQGLLDIAVTSGGKYQEALTLIGEKVQPKQELINIYSDILKTKGKEFVIIDEKFDAKTAKKFSGEKAEGKKYSSYDFIDMKSKYGVDELLFVNVNYGFMISYYGMIETGKMAHAAIDTKIIDLKDQHLIMANQIFKNEVLKKWKDNNYENSVNGVRAAVDKLEAEEKTVFNP